MIITLLSDFGYKDNDVAIAKGMLMSENATAKFIDISHDVEPHHLLQCSYMLRSAYAHFPKHTIHLALFDIIQATGATIWVTMVDHQVIITANNKLIPHTFYNKKITVYKLSQVSSNYMEWLTIVAKFIKQLHKAKYQLDSLGLEVVSDIEAITQLKPGRREQQLECQVIHIDRFGNVVLNLTREEFEEMGGNEGFCIDIPRNESITKLSNYYTDVMPGNQLCMFNSAGYLEIGIREASAAKLLGLTLYNKNQLIYRQIKVTFGDKK